MIFAVDSNRPSDGGGISAEPIAPHEMADHDEPRRPGLCVGLIEQTSELRADAEHAEEPGRHLRAAHTLGAVAPGQADVRLPVAGDSLERRRAALPVEKIGGVHRAEVARGLVERAKIDQLVRACERQRVENPGFRHGERDGRTEDAERDGDHGDRREPGTAP